MWRRTARLILTLVAFSILGAIVILSFLWPVP